LWFVVGFEVVVVVAGRDGDVSWLGDTSDGKAIEL
jgi:hypothetical protein